MQRYIIKRLFIGLLTVFTTVTIVFILTRGFGPADPTAIMLPPDAVPEMREQLRRKFGLDKPLWEQYVLYMKNAVQGDFGESFRHSEPVLDLVVARIPATLQITLSALGVSIFFGMLMGIVSAVKKDRLIDRGGRLIALIGMAVPEFAVALFLMLFFGVMLGWLPISGRGGIEHMIMPVISMSLVGIAQLMRLSRSSMIEVLNSDYIVMARIKGVPDRFVILVHALKNACIPVITIIGLIVPALFTGSVVIETIFSWPGIGNLVMTSIFARDYPVVQLIVILVSALFVISNLIVDIVYAYVDPRIRYQ